MKTLVVVRHAKSSWEDPMLDDFSRPLNDRGKRDAPNMAKRLKEKRITPDLMLTSPARRAQGTCKRMGEVLKYDEGKIKTDRGLYHTDELEVLNVVQGLKDKNEVVMIFGHNPGLTNFVNALGNQNFDNVPTCGVVGFELDIESWKDVAFGKAKLLFYDYPKKSKS